MENLSFFSNPLYSPARIYCNSKNAKFNNININKLETNQEPIPGFTHNHSSNITLSPLINISHNQSKSINLNSNSSNSNRIIKNITTSTLKEENVKLKSTINLINKKNIDLNNQLKILQTEISALNSTKNNSFINIINLIDDTELFNFIENLKSGITQLQKSNSDLYDMYENLQKKNFENVKEKIIFNEKYENLKINYENLNKIFSENRLKLDQNLIELKNYDNQKNIISQEKKIFEKKIRLLEEKAEKLLSINDNNLKNNTINMEIIETLKNRIISLKKNNENEKIKTDDLKNLDYLNNAIEEKDSIIINLNKKLKHYENEREYLNQKIKLMENEFKDKKNFMEDLQQKYQENINEVEKSKSKIQVLNLYLKERDETIENLKTSINFVSKTIDEFKNDYKKIINKNENESFEKMRLIKELDLIKKKLHDLSDLNNELKSDKENLQKRNIENEKDLNEKKNILTKLKFENDVLRKKVDNNNKFIVTIKDEIKNSKLYKINEDFKIEFSKSFEEKNNKLKENERQICIKNKLIDDLQIEIRDNNNEKVLQISELKKIITKKNNDEKELLRKINLNEMEKADLDFEINKLKQELNNYQTRYNSINTRFNEVLNNKYRENIVNKLENSDVYDLNKFNKKNNNIEIFTNNDVNNYSQTFRNDNNYSNLYNMKNIYELNVNQNNNNNSTSVNHYTNNNTNSNINNQNTKSNLDTISYENTLSYLGNINSNLNDNYNQNKYLPYMESVMNLNPFTNRVVSINNKNKIPIDNSNATTSDYPSSTNPYIDKIVPNSTNFNSNPNNNLKISSSENYISNLDNSNMIDNSSVNIDAIIKQIMDSPSSNNKTAFDSIKIEKK
jgi:chromosome segregation ATPase